MKEDTPVGTTIFGDIAVTDADSIGEAIEVKCVDLLDLENTCKKFKVHEIESSQNEYRGMLLLEETLDYNKSHLHKFSLRASVS